MSIQPPNPPFANPLPVPSVHQTEEARKIEVAGYRERLYEPEEVEYRNVKAQTYIDKAATPSHGWGWWLMAAILFALTFASGMAVEKRLTERRYAAVPNPEGLEQRVTAAEKYLNDQAQVLVGQGAEIDGLQEIITEQETKE